MYLAIAVLALALTLGNCAGSSSDTRARVALGSAARPDPTPQATVDKVAYDAKMRALAHGSDEMAGSAGATSSVQGLWPVRAPYPKPGALLPYNRIVAYYGNFYSKRMGILGEYPPQEVLRRLQAAAKQWENADPLTPVIPAIDYIVMSAQGSPGPDGMYRLRMPESHIDKALGMANQVNGLFFLDFQTGWSTVQKEVPRYEKYLVKPNVHLSLDPEFSMKNGVRPGRKVGSLDADDINWAARYLASLVKKHDLPPKVLVVFRFTEGMVTNFEAITPLPEVQIVIAMDGWGPKANKVKTYRSVITTEPVQFTGFKLFYKNDLRAPSKGLMRPAEVLKLLPAPSYIQYQ